MSSHFAVVFFEVMDVLISHAFSLRFRFPRRPFAIVAFRMVARWCLRLLVLLFIFFLAIGIGFIVAIILVTYGFIFCHCSYVWVAIWMSDMHVRVFILVLGVLPPKVSICFVVGSVIFCSQVLLLNFGRIRHVFC